jgi:monofunctional biosynthetic peptidoglycan transglycosylase
MQKNPGVPGNGQSCSHAQCRILNVSRDADRKVNIVTSTNESAAAEDDFEGDRTRGASTISQQGVKNLFFGTKRSILRKGAEVTLVRVAEIVLGKQRILEIYLNVVEWGPGIYGVESACHYYYETTAKNISSQQAARLAAILPAPLKRRPERMNNYSAIILKRMDQMGW